MMMTGKMCGLGVTGRAVVGGFIIGALDSSENLHQGRNLYVIIE